MKETGTYCIVATVFSSYYIFFCEWDFAKLCLHSLEPCIWIAEVECHKVRLQKSKLPGRRQSTSERKTFAVPNVSGFLEVPSFTVCFCFKYLGGIDLFDSLERSFRVELSDRCHIPSKRWGEGRVELREVRHKPQLSQVDLRESSRAPAHAWKRTMTISQFLRLIWIFIYGWYRPLFAFHPHPLFSVNTPVRVDKLTPIGLNACITCFGRQKQSKTIIRNTQEGSFILLQCWRVSSASAWARQGFFIELYLLWFSCSVKIIKEEFPEVEGEEGPLNG